MKIKTQPLGARKHRAARFVAPVLGAILAATAALYPSRQAMASDHRDSPTADANAEGDITDMFAFLNPNDATQLVLIMNVNPFAVPAEKSSYRFSTRFLYQFKIANDGDFDADRVIQAVFDDVPTTTCASGQTIKIFGIARPDSAAGRDRLLYGQPAVTGCTGTTLQQGGMKVFSGLRDDPFVTDVGQLMRILANSQDLFRSFPGFALGPLRGRAVRADNTSGVDGFGGFNVTSIAIELPKSAVRGSGILATPGLVGIWGTVGRPEKINGNPAGHGDRDGEFIQFQRAGQQLFKTIFVPSTMREAFNASQPSGDMQNWSSLVPDTLTTTDNDGTGNTISGRAGLLSCVGIHRCRWRCGRGARTWRTTAVALLIWQHQQEPAACGFASGCAAPESGFDSQRHSSGSRGQWRQWRSTTWSRCVRLAKWPAPRGHGYGHPAATGSAARGRQLSLNTRRARQRTRAARRSELRNGSARPGCFAGHRLDQA